MTTLTTEMERTLRVLYAFTEATPSEISKQLRLVNHKKKSGTIKEELDKLCKMGYAFLYGGSGNFYEITDKGIAYFQT